MTTDKKPVLRLDGDAILAKGEYVRSDLLYGGGDVDLSGIVFKACDLVFDGAALNTLALLTRIYALGGGNMVERIFEKVRAGKYVA